MDFSLRVAGHNIFSVAGQCLLMGCRSLLQHFPGFSPLFECDSQAFYGLDCIFGAAKRVLVIGGCRQGYAALQMKIVLEKSDKNQQRRSSSAKRQEFLESVEDHQSNDESPEDHCTDSETHAGPSRQHARLSHSSRLTLMWPDSFLAIDPEQ
jgi:hypothetical protein